VLLHFVTAALEKAIAREESKMEANALEIIPVLEAKMPRAAAWS